MAAGLRAAEARVRPWLVDDRGREDEQVARQRDRPGRAGGGTTGSIRCGISCCARCRSATTAISAARALVSRMNAELANDLGNLAQRSLSLIARNCGGRAAGRAARRPRTTPRMLAAAEALPALLRGCSTGRRSTRRWRRSGRWCGPATAISTARRPGRCARPIRRAWRRCCACWPTCCARSRRVLQPFMPGSMAQMLDQLGVPADARDLAALAHAAGRRHALPPPQGVFPRYVDDAA